MDNTLKTHYYTDTDGNELIKFSGRYFEVDGIKYTVPYVYQMQSMFKLKNSNCDQTDHTYCLNAYPPVTEEEVDYWISTGEWKKKF